MTIPLASFDTFDTMTVMPMIHEAIAPDLVISYDPDEDVPGQDDAAEPVCDACLEPAERLIDGFCAACWARHEGGV